MYCNPNVINKFHTGNNTLKEVKKVAPKKESQPNTKGDYFLGISSEEFKDTVKDWTGKIGEHVAKELTDWANSKSSESSSSSSEE